VADPWCGWDVPDDVIPSLFAPAPRLADPALLARIRSDLPILIASGDADPLAAGGALIQQLGQRYRDAGVADVTVKLYPAVRHEILNETNRDEVTGDVVECCGLTELSGSKCQSSCYSVRQPKLRLLAHRIFGIAESSSLTCEQISQCISVESTVKLWRMKARNYRPHCIECYGCLQLSWSGQSHR
jgi:acetyl esterase/lipase